MIGIMAITTILSLGSGDSGLVQTEIDLLREEIDSYRRQRSDSAIDEDRKAEISALIRDVLVDAEQRTSFSDPSSNTIASADGRFTFSVEYYTQVDWVLNENSDDGTQYGFQISTSRLTFLGDLYGPDWSYAVRLLLGNGSDGDDQFAYIQGNLSENANIQAGLLCPLFSLEQAIDNNEQLGVYLSFIAGTFDPESSVGVSLFAQEDRVRGWLTLTNGWNQDIESIDGNQRQGVFGRLEWSPFGSFDDLYRFNPHPGDTETSLMFGIGGNFDWGTYAPSGATSVEGDATRLTADLSWQTSGFATLSTINWQDVDPDIPFGGRRWAATTQVAWFPMRRLELYARGEWGTILGIDSTELWMATIGASWYPAGDRRIKFSVELVRGWGDTVNWKIDGNPGIVQIDAPQTAVRTQVQLSF